VCLEADHSKAHGIFQQAAGYDPVGLRNFLGFLERISFRRCAAIPQQRSRAGRRSRGNIKHQSFKISGPGEPFCIATGTMIARQLPDDQREYGSSNRKPRCLDQATALR